MSKSLRVALALVSVSAGMATLAMHAFAADDTAAAAKVDTYVKADGEAFFAIGIEPTGVRPVAAAADVVILFDTSASQAGEFREKALAVLDGVLARLSPDDSVQLMAVDLNAIPLTSTFVTAGGAEMQKALSDLRARVPLGATDMDGALSAATSAFDGSAAGRGRAVIYLGDGMSAANVFSHDRYKPWVDRLVDARTSVTSYAVGPRVDAPLLSVLANQTGGMLAIDDETMSADEVAAYLANAADGEVVWPTSESFPASLTEVLPSRMPPLRYARATNLVGSGTIDAPAEIKVAGEVNGQPVEFTWSVAPSAPNEDFSFLPQVVAQTRKDGGVSLPVLGHDGWRQLASMVNVGAFNLAQLGKQAAMSGNLDQADRLAEQALLLDPSNPDATVIRQTVARTRQAESGDALRISGEPSGAERAAEEALAPGIVQDPLDPEFDGAFLSTVERNTAMFADYIKSEVQIGLDEARGIMGQNPDLAIANMKLLIERVRQAPELDPALRQQLTRSIEAALQAADRESFIQREREITRQELAAQAAAQAEINRELYDREQRIEQLMARFNSLMDEQRYTDAQAVVTLADAMAPRTPAIVAAVEGAEMKHYIAENDRIQLLRQHGFMAMMYPIELSAIPFSDEPPIMYPPPEVWQLLTEKRRKYKAVDLTQDRPAEAKILAALDEQTEVEFIDTELLTVIEYLKDRHGIEMQLDVKALTDAGIGTDTPITMNLRGITLRSALRMILRDLELTYVIRDEILLITTVTEAEGLLQTKVYPVGDLVIPITSGGGGGGGGIGGGGGGGGFFAVNDELKISSTPTIENTTVAPVPAGKVLTVESSVSPEAAWSDYFSKNTATEVDVRETVRHLMSEGKHGEAVAVIMGAIQHQQGQPWMYEGLALAMELDARSKEDIERALMSLADFSISSVDLYNLAEYMERLGMDRSALMLYRQSSALEPLAPFPYVAGLRLAERAQDVDAIRWSSVGILSQAWPKDLRNIWLTAFRAASGTLEQLRKEGRSDEADAFESELNSAVVRDCVVIVSWIGDADLDLMVEEPGGTTCSYRQPWSTAGGVMLGDALLPNEKKTPNTKTEVYVCTKAFDGMYKMLVRRVWGKLPVDRVTVDIYAHKGSANERVFHRSVAIQNDEAVFAFEMKNGRRKESLSEQALATAFADQMAVNYGNKVLAQQQTLNQQLNQLAGNGTLGGVLSSPGRLNGGFVPFVSGAVGYQPVITTLPKGTQMFTNAVVSADRRYVRISPAPFFTSIPEVNTFNYATGSSGTSGGAGGGGSF